MDPKQRAGEKALEYLRSGMIVGLGTGSTARFFIQALANALRDGRLTGIRGLPTSIASEQLARDSGLPIVGFADVAGADITVDGADEIDENNLNLIKGLGGALLREKMVAQNSDRLVIIADSSKVVTKLGTHSPLPVEVTPFGLEASESFLQKQNCRPKLRLQANGKTFVTDNGNFIFDCHFDGISDPCNLNAALTTRAGIVESGLFLGMADVAIIADENSTRIISRPASPELGQAARSSGPKKTRASAHR